MKYFLLVGITLFNEVNAQIHENSFQQKASVFVEQTADIYKPPGMKNLGDPEKYFWPKTIARFEKYGITDSLGNAWITAMKDNPPFHFTLLGMARLFCKYPNAPSIKKHKITILKAVFDRRDNYNAWTSEGTENHISMSRTSGYLFAQAAVHYPQEFPSAANKIAEMKNWILKVADRTLQMGTGEWNSAIYTAYNLYGFINLYDFAQDEEVKNAAKKVLDYYATEIALHYSFGIIGGAEMRGNGALDFDHTATRYLAWLWYGTLEEQPVLQGSQYIQTLHAVTSSYRPTRAMHALARKETKTPLWFTGSKPSYLFEDTSFVKQYFYATPNFTLGTAVSSYGGWTGGNYQLVNWKLVAKSDEVEPIQISGNGLTFEEFSGKARDPFTQYFQHKNVLIQVSFQPENIDKLVKEAKTITEEWSKKWRKDFEQRFPIHDRHNIVNFNKNILANNASFLNFPGDINIELDGNIAFVKLPHTYLAILILGDENKVSTSSKLIKKSKRQLLQIEEVLGKACGFVLVSFDSEDFLSYEAFKSDYKMHHQLKKEEFKEKGKFTYYSINEEVIDFEFGKYGTCMEALVDWGYGTTSQMVFPTAPPFQQPKWPKGSGWGRLPKVKVNGKEVDFEKTIPVYSGNGLLMGNGKNLLDTPWSK